MSNIINKNDGRIKKTKNNLEKAMLELLADKPLSELTVRELCKTAGTTTITFYNHYKDKYALLDEIYQNLTDVIIENFKQLQASNNLDNDIVQACCNLLDSTIDAFRIKYAEFNINTPNTDSYIFISMSKEITQGLYSFLASSNMTTNIDLKYFSAFLSYGLWGVIDQGLQNNLSINEIRKNSKLLLRAVIKNDL